MALPTAPYIIFYSYRNGNPPRPGIYTGIPHTHTRATRDLSSSEHVGDEFFYSGEVFGRRIA